VVAKLDRLSRDVAFIASLMANKVPFLCADLGTDTDPFMLHIRSLRGRLSDSFQVPTSPPADNARWRMQISSRFLLCCRSHRCC